VYFKLGTVCLFALIRVANVLSSYWLSLWSSKYVLRLFFPSIYLLSLFFSSLNYTVHVYLATYIALLIVTSLLYRLGLQLVLKLTFNAAVNLHSRMLSVVMAAKPSFFDMTPTGRIMNRFSSKPLSLSCFFYRINCRLYFISFFFPANFPVFIYFLF
jgi:ABC-type multidrug transport system fused ATPase/permease subunit